MANQLLTDNISSTTRFLDTAFEMAVEQEILLADYDKSVFKIVKTCVEHTITQKYINGNKLICEGYFRISVFYQPPQEEKLTVVTKKQPFRHQIDLSQSVQSPYFIPLTGELQYVNTRAVSPTRISVSGVYAFGVKGYRVQSVPVITAVSSQSACRDSENITNFTLSGSGLRQFSMEDELSLPQNMEKILNITPTSSNYTVNTYQDKVNVKGEVTMDIAYIADNSLEISHNTKTFMYNQVVDMPGVAENNVAYADFSVVNFTVTANPDTGKVNCILVANLDIKAFRQENVITVLDCFSKSFEYEKSHKKLLWDTNITSVSKTLNFQVEDAITGSCTPVYTILNASSPIVSLSDGKPAVKSKVSVSVIVKNEDREFECFTKTGEVTLDIQADIDEADDIIITCHPYGGDVAISSETMKARFAIDVKGFVIRHRQADILVDFSEKISSPVSNPDDALILYYGEKGENIFEIAMRYKTDIELIMSENHIENKILPEEKILLIPAYRQ